MQDNRLPDFKLCPALEASSVDSLEKADSAPQCERTLLLVDDEANVLNALTRLLRPDGYRLLRADSGEAGLELLATNQVGVIVSDQRMPGMSGVEFLRRAKLVHPETVRMVLSGYTELKSVTDAINEGAVYKFLTKPWDDDLLRSHILDAFLHYELRAENARLARALAVANDRLSRAKSVLEVEMANSIDVLKVSQEMLELLPVGALGVDRDGWIVSANRKAEEMLSFPEGPAGPLISSMAAERLPPAMAASIARVLEGRLPECTRWHSPAGEEVEFCCYVLGATSASQGVMLAILPVLGASR